MEKKWDEQEIEQARRLISQVDGVEAVTLLPGTNDRPLDSIYVSAHHHINPKFLVRIIQVLLKNVMNRKIDYRIVTIHKNSEGGDFTQT